MKFETYEYLSKFITSDIDALADNLYRAKAAFKNKTPEQMQEKYGQSDSTCQEIIDGYQKWHDRALAVKQELGSL